MRCLWAVLRAWWRDRTRLVNWPQGGAPAEWHGMRADPPPPGWPDGVPFPGGRYEA